MKVFLLFRPLFAMCPYYSGLFKLALLCGARHAKCSYYLGLKNAKCPYYLGVYNILCFSVLIMLQTVLIVWCFKCKMSLLIGALQNVLIM